MAVSSFAGGSNNRRRTTRTNYGGMSPGQRRRSLLGNTAANNAASERFRRRRATQAANTTPDPLTNAIAGGSTGLSNADVMNMMGGTQGAVPVNTSMSNADVMNMMGNTQGAVPANAPPPPPPPPPPKPSNADVMNMMGNTQGAVPTNTTKSPLDGSVRPGGGPPFPSFTTTNVATGPDTGVSQTQFVPEDPSKAMASLQGDSGPVPGSPGDLQRVEEMMGGTQGLVPVNTSQTNADVMNMMGNTQFNDRLADQLKDERIQRQKPMSAQDYFSISTGQTPFEPPEKLSRPEIEKMMGDTQGGVVADENIEAFKEEAERNRSSLPDLSNLAAIEDMFTRTQGEVPVDNASVEDTMERTLGGLSTFSTEDNIEDIMEKTQGAIADTKDADLEKQMREQADMAARQSSGLTTFAAKDPALSFTVDPTTGLRTFAGASEFNPNAVGLDEIGDDQDEGLETFAARGSRYNRGAEKLRRQADKRLSGTLQDRLEQAYLGRIDAADDPILASQIADQQLRQQEAQQGLVEQLSRYGVLRGGGDTAAALTRMAEGNERNRLALEAAAAQRRQGDLRDALAFDQARSSMDIAQRGQSLEERLAADRLLDTALGRDVTRADVTGQFRDITSPTGYRDTLAAQRQRQQMDIERRAQDLREDIGAQDIATSRLNRDVTRAGQTGQFRDETSPTGFRDTLAAQELRQRMQIEEDIADQTIKDRRQARNIAAAGLTGQFQGSDTLQAQEQDQRMRLAMADATGLLDTGAANQAPIETLAGARQRRELDLAESAQDMRERLAAQDIATSALGRDVTRAGLTGQFERQDTLQAQLQRQQMQLAEDANRRADIAQEAGLLGEIAGEGSAPARTTLAGRELALREDMARAEDLRAQQAAESALFGQIVTGAANQAPIRTLEGQRAQSALDSAALAREATEAGLTGRFDGALTADERDRDLARRISEAGVTGVFDTGSATQGPIDTIQSQVIESSLQNEALNRALGRAGATGQFREEGDTADPTETLESRLRTAGLTGQLDDDITLAGREARQDLIGSILAASDPELKGRTDSLAEALTRQLGDDFGLDDVSGAMRIDAGNATSEEVAADLFPRLDGMSEEQQENEIRRLADLGYDMREIERQMEQMREAERRKQALEEARRRREERERNAKLEEPTQEEIDAEIERRMRERGN